MCIEQLTYAGVFEAVQIRKSGYPFRLPHRRFANRYRCLAYKESGWIGLGTREGDYKGMCSALLRCVNQVGLVWFGLVWFGLVWFGLVWFGLVWVGLVWFGWLFG